MIWHPKSSVKFLQVFPLADRIKAEPFPNGDEPIAARCGDYAVLADANGLTAMPEGTKSFPLVKHWQKQMPLASADAAREVIGRAPLKKAWFEARGWNRTSFDA